MAYPVIQAYKQAAEDLVRVQAIDRSPVPRVSRATRILEMSILDACRVLVLYKWLGACFSWGALRGRCTALPRAASNQAHTLYIKLNDCASFERPN
jgi:hypothetical protein